MNILLKNWQFVLVGFFVLLSVFSILYYGVNLGIDFKGGTLYQVELQRSVEYEEMARIINTIEQRIDPTGLKGNELSPIGNRFIIIKTAETDPVELERIESRIRQQGKFEATLDGETVFTGDEIKKVLRGSFSFGVQRLSPDVYKWSLPFMLNETATKRFTQKTFHKCEVLGAGQGGKLNYECEKTTFFLDKPDALVVMSADKYNSDKKLMLEGNRLNNIPQGSSIEELIEDSQLTVIIFDPNTGFDENKAKSVLAKTKLAIVSEDVNDSTIENLSAMGFLVEKKIGKEGLPWLWTVSGAKQVIRLTEGITNEDVADISFAKEFSTLEITGSRESYREAKQELEELAILLESGSLPTPVSAISKETISPALGQSFLNNIFLMGILAVIIVAVVIFVRFRTMPLAVPVFATVLAETIILLGILSLPIIRQPFDLAALAGLVAALGSGVNAEIVIVDELVSRTKRKTMSLFQRVKAGLFIITTSAITVIGVMGPIVLFSRSMPGLSSLYGFAIVAILGAIIGVVITRPAFTKIVEAVVAKKEAKE